MCYINNMRTAQIKAIKISNGKWTATYKMDDGNWKNLQITDYKKGGKKIDTYRTKWEALASARNSVYTACIFDNGVKIEELKTEKQLNRKDLTGLFSVCLINTGERVA